MTTEIIFADRIMGIALQNGLVRMELGVMESPRKGEPQKIALTTKLVMPLEGFVNSFNLQESVIKELVARQARAQSAPADAATPEASADANADTTPATVTTTRAAS
jgi:hypothetical protein